MTIAQAILTLFSVLSLVLLGLSLRSHKQALELLGQGDHYKRQLFAFRILQCLIPWPVITILTIFVMPEYALYAFAIGQLVLSYWVLIHPTDHVRIIQEVSLTMQAAAQASEVSAALTKKLHESNKDLRSLTKKLEVARQEAEAAARAKSSFLANISHELRTPLNGILGYAQLLMQDEELGKLEKAQSGVKIIHSSGHHLLNLINEFLDFSKIEAGKVEILSSPFDPNMVLTSTLNVIGVQAEQKGLKVNNDIAQDLPKCLIGDEKRLRQVLLNLLGNAVKFTDKGHIGLSVRCQPSSKPDQVTLKFEVKDTGTGISEENQTLIFRPFEQLPYKRGRQGSGLGLAITRNIIELLGGELNVTSTLGEGSCFSFSISYTVDDSQAPITSATSHDGANVKSVSGYEGPRQRVLVVDDVLTNRLVLTAFLKPLGFELVEAEDGEQALKKAEEFRPHIVLTDIVMPVMDGVVFTQTLRTKEYGRDIVVIALTASIMENMDDLGEQGFNDTLLKPFSLQSILTLLEKHLKLKWITGGRPSSKPSLASRPPEELLSKLRTLTEDGDILELRREIQAHKNDGKFLMFFQQLEELAQKYQEDAILELLKRT